jgi:hypothetical protein
MFKKGIKAIAEMGVSLLGPYLTECLQNSQGIYFSKQLHQYYKIAKNYFLVWQNMSLKSHIPSL